MGYLVMLTTGYIWMNNQSGEYVTPFRQRFNHPGFSD